MTFKSPVWYPIAVVLSVGNVVAAGFAAAVAEPWHAATHTSLAVAFGLWAQRLRQGRAGSEHQTDIQAELQAGLEALEIEVGKLRQELSETQERMDFAERVLAQRSEPRRVGPDR